MGERVFNLHRAILVREGHRGREDDRLEDFNYSVPLESDHGNPECLAPGKDGEPISRKGAVVERDKFEAMMSEYYALRGWDVASGFQTRIKLRELGLTDIANNLEKRGLLK
jgi:aldehyde:ferredoxin oxidoreductase